MLIVVDPHSGVPVYRQLMDQIRLHVASGVLREGDPLPSTRNLSLELGINPMTISKAYNLLEREGVVEHRPGRHLVVAPLPAGEMIRQRIDRLREGLAPGARLARQLGIPAAEALRLFEDLLTAAGPDEETKESRP